ncbi:phosphate uptake regulator, PhoU [Nocardia higoensis]|uniref:Phosphate uptake regulator, PhoU n=1 Tax=Nocardia higoensis TaxID=228599 RepID=A0ABS0DGM0_9NOCA|nr:phosphate uptake regulator, PhoU [Nocardia higoensis]
MGENPCVRTQFTHELHDLTNSLTLMCRLAHDTVERGVDALADADLTAAYEVFALEEQLRAAHRTCESRTVALLALQAPVARDLRRVVTAMQIAGQLAKVGALSSRVADQVYRRHPEHAAPQPILEVLTELGRAAALRMARVGTAIAYDHPPSDRVREDSLPADPPRREHRRAEHRLPDSGVGIESDTTPAQLLERLHAALTDPGNPHPPADVIALTLLGSHLERCVEHADRIDGLVRFLDTGVPPTAQTTDSDSRPAEI